MSFFRYFSLFFPCILWQLFGQGNYNTPIGRTPRTAIPRQRQLFPGIPLIIACFRKGFFGVEVPVRCVC